MKGWLTVTKSNEKWLSVMDIEKQTGIPDATIRRYLRNHGHHIQIKKRGKVYFISSDSLVVIKKIRELYDKGKQSEDIEETLRDMNVPVTITVTDDEKEVTVNASEVLLQLKKEMNEQKKFNQLLLETLQKQQEYINTKLEERDRKLNESLREILESKKEIASSERKKGFFAKIFKI
jgi:DNA-binding transcriptional MerR regulator